MKGKILIFVAGSFLGAAVAGFVYRYTKELRIAYGWLRLEWQWICVGVTAALLLGLVLWDVFKKKKA